MQKTAQWRTDSLSNSLVQKGVFESFGHSRGDPGPLKVTKSEKLKLRGELGRKSCPPSAPQLKSPFHACSQKQFVLDLCPKFFGLDYAVRRVQAWNSSQTISALNKIKVWQNQEKGYPESTFSFISKPPFCPWDNIFELFVVFVCL